MFLKTLHQNGVFDLKPFNHQKKIVASSADGSFSVWDTQSAELLYHIKLKEQKIRSINFNLDESLLLACGSSGYIYVFETSSFKEIGCFKAHELAANIAIFHPKKRVIISGGVGANKTLRKKIIAECNQNEFEYFFPDLTFCTDNGAMIALAGSLRLNMRPKENYSFSVKPRWKLTEI